ncbi:MAG: glutathione S-transferase [Proteobacteria bacterium]|nr:glutathione S-transferase [Pseudomonadota bacterium]
MVHEIILHNFASSPFSEKVRLVLGIKGLSWRWSEIPSMLPKPDLTPMTGGYRKTPVMQIGADIFCDSQLIIRELERRFPATSVTPHGQGLPYGLGFWTDRVLFMATVTLIFGEIGHMVPEDFKKDREAMSGGAFSVDAMKRATPAMRDQWRAHAGFIAEQLSDHRSFLEGGKPTLADINCYMNFWFIKNAVPQTAANLLKEFPLIEAWCGRVKAIGHGLHTSIDSKEALRIAKEATPDAKRADDPFDPQGLKPGDNVKVGADDYGKDQIAGEIVFGNAHEIAILRSDPSVGDVVVHFPRAGFTVTPS